MMSKFKVNNLIMFIVTIFPVSSYADIYQCDVDGKTIFSDKPCAEDAEIIDIQVKEKIIQSSNNTPGTVNKNVPNIPEQPKLDLRKARGGARAVASPTDE